MNNIMIIFLQENFAHHALSFGGQWLLAHAVQLIVLWYVQVEQPQQMLVTGQT